MGAGIPVMRSPRSIAAILFVSSISSVWGFGCGDSDLLTTPTALVSRTSDTPARLSDVIDLDKPGQIAYRRTGDVPTGGPGNVVYRSNGRLRRWDNVVSESRSPNEGSFNVYKTEGGVTEVFGCIWIALPGDRTQVRAECVEGGSARVMEGMLNAAMMTDLIAEELDPRVILGRQARCFRIEPLQEICVSDGGDLLYMALSGGETGQVFEATYAFDEYEEFDWPYDSADPFKPTSFEDLRPASALDFPREFGLLSEELP